MGCIQCTYDQGVQLRFVDTDFAMENNLLHYRLLKESNGTTFFGTKGWISLSRSSAQSNIESIDIKLNDFPKNNSGWIRGEENIMGQLFVDVIKGKINEVCPLNEAVLSDCVSHMSNIAIRSGRKIIWDPASGQVVDDPEANKLFVRKSRPPYTI
jgi:hypothetical protein